MYEECYINFELAQRLKQTGFPQHKSPTTYFVGDDKKRGCEVGELVHHPSTETDTHLIDAPTQDALCRWLRETQGIDILVDVVEHWIELKEGCYYRYRIYKNRKYIEDDEDYLYETYDKAVAAALRKIFKKYKGYKLDYERKATNYD